MIVGMQSIHQHRPFNTASIKDSTEDREFFVFHVINSVSCKFSVICHIKDKNYNDRFD